MRRDPGVDERFWTKVDMKGSVSERRPDLGPCWIWMAAKTRGYGNFNNTYAHRWSYERLIGPIPDGLELDHLCYVTACVRPRHLEPVTHRENLIRRAPAADTQAAS